MSVELKLNLVTIINHTINRNFEMERGGEGGGRAAGRIPQILNFYIIYYWKTDENVVLNFNIVEVEVEGRGPPFLIFNYYW